MLNEKYSKYKDIFIKTGVSTVLIGILSISSAFADNYESIGKRDLTLEDVLDDMMHKKDINQAKSEFGEPSRVRKIENNQDLFEWKASYKDEDNDKTRSCRVFILVQSDAITGWGSNCKREHAISAPRTRLVPLDKPIPKSVMPANIRAIINKELQENGTRDKTIADELASQVGKSEEIVLTMHSELQSSQKLDNGKTMRTYFGYGEYRPDWDNSSGKWVSLGYTPRCEYYLFFLKGTLVGYNAEKCKTAGIEYKETLSAKYPPAPWSK